MYNCSTLLKATVILYYVPNVLSSALQVAVKVPMYYVQCCKKLHSNVVMHSIIVLFVLESRGPYIKGLGCDLQDRTNGLIVHCMGY